MCALGREVALDGEYYQPTDPVCRQRAGQLFDETQSLMENGTITPHPHRMIGNGYQSVLKRIELLAKRVLGERLIVFIL